ncbi:MAG: AAA family ATPase [bacterium]|nr:AAA family ATPase [bacterium]
MTNPPNPEKVREEISEFLRNRYGNQVAVTDVDLNIPHEGTATTQSSLFEQIDFTLKPTELEEYLRQYVLHQEEAVEILATKICTHFHRRKWELDHPDRETSAGQIKSNILMIGPTGVGKTYLVKLIADKIGVPFVKGDATKFSETGYVGGDVEDLVRSLVREAKGDMKLAEYGIIYVDEIDKIASSGNLVGPDVSRSGVQRALLKLMEETEVDLRTPHDLASQMEAVIETQRTGRAERKKVSTRNMLFLVSGAFSGLADIIRRRLAKGTMGFRRDEDLPRGDQDVLRRVTTTDLMEYGFESEFVGRLPVIAQLHELGETALYDVLTNAHSAVTRGKMRDFAAYGVELSFDDDALKEIARRAYQARIGARGLMTVMERSLIRFEKLLPTSGVRKLHVTRDLILEPERVALEILASDGVAVFQRKFLERSGLVLEFPKESVTWVRENLGGEPARIADRLAEMFQNYEYGMKLAGVQSQKVTPDMLADPDVFLDRMIKKAYEEKGNPGGEVH